jgi:hypothetical protein
MSTNELTQLPANHSWLYRSSYIDRFMCFIQRLPVPFWLTYLLLFALQAVLNYGIAWSEGALPSSTFVRILLIYPLWQWIPFAIMTLLNNTAKKVLDAFRPLLTLGDEEFALLKAEFTTMPLRGVLITNLFWLIFYVIIIILYQNAYLTVGFGQVTRWTTIIEGAFSYSISSVIYYHSLRQLALVHRTVKRVKRINLFALEPVYAFSRLTALTGISWVLMLGLTILFFPFILAPGLMLVISIIMLTLAVSAFALPLRAVNQHLVLQKQSLLAEHQRRVEAALSLFHHQLDQDNLTGMEQFEKAINSLTAERKILEEIPTWPWRTATLTGFLSAAVLPIVLLLVQIAIQRWLTP